MDMELTAEGLLEWLCGWTKSTGGADMDRPIWAAIREWAGGGGVYTVDGRSRGISSPFDSSGSLSAAFGECLAGD
jgi:hypothetical protein